MGDSSEKEEKLDYMKKDLFQPVARPWHANGNADDDSNHLFMSEPSVSEIDDSEDNMRLLSPMDSYLEDSGDENDGLPPPPPPPARLMMTQSPVSPGGNTSLSSWESPHLMRRIHLHFSPDHRQEKQSLDTAVQATAQGPQLVMPIPQPSNHPQHHNREGVVAPTPAGAKTPDRSIVHSSTSTSPVSEGQRERLEGFLADLRINSQGQVQELSASGANASSFESSFHAPPNHRLDLNGVLRTTAGAAQHARMSSMDTAVVQNTTPTGSVAHLSFAPSQNTHVNPDDTIVMMLSASEDEGMIFSASEDEGDDSKQVSKTTTSNNGSCQPVDWEDKTSADDEKTAERPRRIRGKPHVGGHRRQRSGDAAAATLSTGSMEWKGMEQDKIPLPPAPGDHDDDDETDGNNEGEERESGEFNDQNDAYRSKRSKMEGGGFAPKAAGEIAQFSRFALGASGNDSTAARRQTRRQRRDVRARKQTGSARDSEESSSYASADPPPHADYSNDQPPAAFHGAPRPNQIPVGRRSLPSPALAGYDPRVSGQHARQASQPTYWSPQSFHSGSSTLDSYGYQNPPSWNPTWQNNPYDNSPQFGGRRGDSGALLGKAERPMSTRDQSAQQSSGSIETAFSWLSARRTSETEIRGIADPEMSPLIGPGKSEEKGDSQHIFDSESESSSSVENKRNEHFLHPNMQQSNVEASPLQGLRHTLSPLANIGKAFQKADRRRFLPSTGLEEDDKKYPTYVCPVCKTRQREFFSVSSAPRQFESASGYIAIYFGIYVIAALYIFGLQEGWGKLDCIYFAVITLTTAGLGDFVPTSDGAKILCSVFIYFGVACIGLLLGSYIAGMLDESSSREARANRIKACPTCGRIQNIKDAAKRRLGGRPFEQSTENHHGSHFMSMRATATTESRPFERDPKKMKRQHKRDSPEDSKRSGLVQTENLMGTRTTKSGPGTEEPEIFPISASLSKDGVPMETIASPLLREHNTTTTFVSPKTQQKPMNPMSSPSTTEILRRQSHSRHTSLDLNSGNFAAAFGRAGARGRKFSVDLPSTMEESTDAQQKHAASPPVWHPETYNQVEGGDDESTYSETSSSSSGDSVELDYQYTAVKNAKYVFLTLREALMNSLVIIVFGCMGFYFIEGFSIVDSWYFTTVLLTTVGYGDLVPYTKGGKLFATVYILVAGTILLNNMSMISMIPLELRKRRTENAVLTQFGDQLDDAALGELATGPVIQRLNLATHTPGGLDECTREMFSLAMLVRLGKVTEEDIKLTFAAFRKLDVHDDGVLNSKSIIAGMIQKRKNISCLNLKNLGEVQPQFHQAPAQQNAAQQSYGAVNSSFSNSWGNGSGYGQQWFGSYTADTPTGDSAAEEVQNGGLSTPTEQSSFVHGQSLYNSNSASMQSESLRRGGFSH